MRHCTRLLFLAIILGIGAAAGGGEAVSDRELIEAVTAELREQGATEPDAAAVVDALNGITVKLYGDGRYPEAEQAARTALAEAERLLGAEHPQTLTSADNLAFLYQAQGGYAEAEPLFRRALAGRERVLGAEHPDTCQSVNNLAFLYQAQGRYGEAEPLYRRALAAREQVLGADHPDTLVSVNNLAFLYQVQGRYGDAERLYRRALAASDRVLGAEHPQTLTSVNNLAGLYQAQGHYDKAEPLYRRALADRERVLGSEHPQTLTSVNNLAGLYEAQGHYGKAEPLYRRALADRERVLGAEHPDTLQSTNNLAALYQAQGRYGEAEPMYRRALAAIERGLGDEHPDTLQIVNNLAFMYQVQGRYGEAEPLYRQALAARERVLGAEHPQTLTSVNNLAFLHQALGRNNEAERLYRRAVATSERALGVEHPQTVTVVNNLAGLYQSQGRYGAAEPLLRQALAARERRLGAEHPDTLQSVNNLAGLYRAQDRYGEAEPLFRRALKGYERQLNEAHPNTIEVQLNLLGTLVNLDRIAPALEQLRTLDGRLRSFVARQLDSTESERVRRLWLETESRFQHIAFTLALAHPDGPALPLAADILLRWKRLMGQEDALLTRLARRSPDPQVRALAVQVQEARTRYSRLVNRPEPQPAQLAALKEALADLDRLEVALRTRSRTFAEGDAAHAVTGEEVARVLPHGTALLDLRAYKPIDFETGERGEDHWLALLIVAKDPATTGPAGPIARPADWHPGPLPTLRILDLGPVAASDPHRSRMTRLIDEDVCLTRYLDWQDQGAKPNKRPGCIDGYDAAHFATPAAADARAAAITTEIDTASARFYTTLLGSLDRELAGYATLYLAPDAVLDLVPFARLRLPDGRYWVERQTLRILRGGRDLIPHAPVAPARGLLALGAIDYDAAVPAPTPGQSPPGPAAPGPPLAMADTGAPVSYPGLRAACRHFPPLPNTADELDYLQGHVETDSGKVLILRGADASKSRLESQATPPRILHLATHGCFVGGSQPAQRPMTRSLLALAGANRADAADGAGTADDGLLHAMEVLDLDLTGTELVALSACDTGRGEVDSSEGVYGMVRAFQIAGAGNVLMTLWALNDGLGTEFVADFYRNWLAAGPAAPADPASALRATQLDWIRSERPEKRDPRHWAPYVLLERR